MAQIDYDGIGIVRVVNHQGTVLYDRASGNTAVNVSGWSGQMDVSSRMKNITESTGRGQTRHGSTG